MRRILACALLMTGTVLTGAPDASDTIVSSHAAADADISANPRSAFWQKIPGVFINQDNSGHPLTTDKTEIRTRWTSSNLYILFVCHYAKLTVRPNPVLDKDTVGLWNTDVAEAFIGDDFQNIKRYKEFEVSPQGEWVDLDIDRGNPDNGKDAWRWNSGFTVKTIVDKQKNVWYGEMKIPFAAISKKPVQSGTELRINFYRAQGSPPSQLLIAWQSTHAPSFHVPEAFGKIRLGE